MKIIVKENKYNLLIYLIGLFMLFSVNISAAQDICAPLAGEKKSIEKINTEESEVLDNTNDSSDSVTVRFTAPLEKTGHILKTALFLLPVFAVILSPFCFCRIFRESAADIIHNIYRFLGKKNVPHTKQEEAKETPKANIVNL